MKFSEFANRFSAESGIATLMEDLGEALAGDRRVLMLGGGNPAHIPAVQDYFNRRLRYFVDHPREFAQVIGNYDAPRGEKRFIGALADFFNRHYHWGIGPENIVLTAGSQTGFFMLFNSLAGLFPGGARRRILFPMVPEYIGYADVGLSDNLFTAAMPQIETFEDRTFKYHVDFKNLTVDGNTGAICLSRPTNPTGNVMTDHELEQLHAIAEQHDIPLIIDNAYGMPFPDIIFTGATLRWSPRTILCMSLSKLGLPAVRTGIIIAQEDITAAIARMNGIISLALGSFGPAMVQELIESDAILALSRDHIRPFYQERAQLAIRLFQQELEGLDYYIHRAEGAIFLWLWFPGLAVTARELYERLKRRNVLIIPGQYFFPGLEQEWQHMHECIRVSYAMQEDTVTEGIRIIAEEVRALQR